MRVGVLVTGDIAVRAAHSLAARQEVDEVVVIGPARSKSFKVVETASGCDYLIGTGPEAPKKARRHGVSLIWSGDVRADGVEVWGANPSGLTLSLASREADPRLIALAHPEASGGREHSARFPDPIGHADVTGAELGGRLLAVAKSPNQFAAALAIGAKRRVAIVDHGAFMSGIALAAGLAVADGEPKPVWDDALSYLKAATALGLVMAEDV